MRPLGTFQSNGYHGNDDRYKIFGFSFGYVFPRSLTVQGFITIKWHKKKLSIIKIFNFLFLTTLTIDISLQFNILEKNICFIRRQTYYLVGLRHEKTKKLSCKFRNTSLLNPSRTCFKTKSETKMALRDEPMHSYNHKQPSRKPYKNSWTTFTNFLIPYCSSLKTG